MKERFEKTMGYLIFEILVFYGLPIIFLIFEIREFYALLPVIDLCFALAVGFFFGKKCGGDWLMALESGAVFIPCIYIFFNSTAWIYVPVIAVASLFSLFIGAVFRNRFVR